METEKLKSLAFWIMIVVVISLCVYLIVYINSESYQCMNSPLTYGVSKYETSDGSVFSCECSSPLSKGYMLVTRENISFISFSNYPVTQDFLLPNS